MITGIAHLRARDALCPCYRNDENAFVGEGEPADWFLDRLNTLFWLSFLTPRQQKLLCLYYSLWDDRGYERDIVDLIARSEGVPADMVRAAYHEALRDLSKLIH
jgi:hypothetical protein